MKRLRPLALFVLFAPVLVGATAPSPVVTTARGLVVAAEPRAAEAGAAVLRRGGNAVDAAVTTALTLAVTYPRAGNIGGGGFMIVRLADGTATAVDFRETAPGAATRGMYLGPDGKVVPGRSTLGHLAVGVPGTVAGLDLVLKRHGSGKLTWAELVEPARMLAEQGFVVNDEMAEDLRASDELLGANAAAKKVFLNDGRFFADGDTLRQPDLAATLARLQAHGPGEFYTGRTAELIAADMAAHGGLITREDLAAYRPAVREVLRGTYRGHEILTMPPPSSGGIALLQMFAMLEDRDVAALAPAGADKIHLFAEVMRRAYADRAAYLGDPDFTTIPVASLLDRAYLARRGATIDLARATPSRGLAGGLAEAAAARPESMETTHFSVMDAEGNVVSCTYTINGIYGSGVVAAGTGILLNNEMDDFTSRPGTPNAFGLVQGEANAIEPRKRPLSSMTPTIVLRDGKVVIVTGSPGGATIINTVLQVLTNLIDHGMTPQDAVFAKRFNHQWLPDSISHEPDFPAPEVVEALKSKGHELRIRRLYSNEAPRWSGTQGSAETIVVDPATGLRTGVPDNRRPGTAAVAEDSASDATALAEPAKSHLPADFYDSWAAGLVRLDSEPGRALRTPDAPDYEPLRQKWVPQLKSHCGACSAVIVNNSLLPGAGFTQDSIFNASTAHIIAQETVYKIGFTLEELTEMIRTTSGLRATRYHAGEDAAAGEHGYAAWLAALKADRQSANDRLICNFATGWLRERKNNGGHFSIVADYNEAKNQVLILEVSGGRPSFWVDTREMWDAMT
ncbi:MAG: gamma-glutamyltransferase, partial [Opitutaceae bacterium]|nr:gamma-glutamyltransferase [Opitutaceae bacterium]